MSYLSLISFIYPECAGMFRWNFLPWIKTSKTVSAVKNLTFGVHVSLNPLVVTYKSSLVILSFNPNQYNKILGLVGHHGSGRTAAIKMIMGRLTPTAGRIVVQQEYMRPKVQDINS